MVPCSSVFVVSVIHACVTCAAAGFQLAKGECKDEAEAHSPGRLQGEEGCCGLVQQQPLRGLL